MSSSVHTLKLDIDWKLINTISKIDRFDASWVSIEKREGQSLKQLKSMATIKSVGSSTRIEGSKMSDKEVDVLLKNLEIKKLEDRDAQEVAGYFEVLDTISESHEGINVSANAIKGLHSTLMKYNEKDQWHKGNYKQHKNSVEATLADGTVNLIFETTPPGHQTEDEMRSLIEWYDEDQTTHPLVKCALLTYEFLSIHPFQDGNGRLSRLISTLLLLKNGYKWIQYVSLEHEMENRKVEYYRVLRSCQSQRPNEDITSWINFFFNALINIQEQLLKKLKTKGTLAKLSPKEKSILVFIESNPGCKSGQIAEKLDIPNPTVKRILSIMVDQKLIEKFGAGPGTNYSVM